MEPLTIITTGQQVIGGIVGLFTGRPDYGQTEAWQRNIHKSIVEPVIREYFSDNPASETWLKEGWANMGSKEAYTSYLKNLRRGLVTGQPIWHKESTWQKGRFNFIPEINAAFTAAGVPNITTGDKLSSGNNTFNMPSLNSLGAYSKYIPFVLIGIVLIFFMYKRK